MDQHDHLTSDMRERWEMEARGHDEEQPLIKSRIIEMLKRDPKISWASLELGIARWCSASTIRRWITSFDSFPTYCERESSLAFGQAETISVDICRTLPEKVNGMKRKDSADWE
jgi:hypothetical protein